MTVSDYICSALVTVPLIAMLLKWIYDEAKPHFKGTPRHQALCRQIWEFEAEVYQRVSYDQGDMRLKATTVLGELLVTIGVSSKRCRIDYFQLEGWNYYPYSESWNRYPDYVLGVVLSSRAQLLAQIDKLVVEHLAVQQVLKQIVEDALKNVRVDHD